VNEPAAEFECDINRFSVPAAKQWRQRIVVSDGPEFPQPLVVEAGNENRPTVGLRQKFGQHGPGACRLQLYVDTDAFRQHVENFLEERHPGAAPGIGTPQLRKRRLGDTTAKVGRSVQRRIVDDDQGVFTTADVELDGSNPELRRQLKARQRVFREQASGPAMADDQRGLIEWVGYFLPTSMNGKSLQ